MIGNFPASYNVFLYLTKYFKNLEYYLYKIIKSVLKSFVCFYKSLKEDH